LPPPAETLEPAIHSPEQNTNNAATQETILVFIDRISFPQLKWGRAGSSTPTGNAGDIHRVQTSRDLHIAVFPIDAIPGIRLCVDGRLHYTDPCSGWHGARQRLISE